MTWEQILQRYRASCIVGQAANTQKLTFRWMNRWVAFCRLQGVEEPSLLTQTTLHAFQAELTWKACSNGSLYSPNTVDQGLRMIRTFLRWTDRQGLLLQGDLSEGMILPRVPRPIYRVLTTNEVKTLLAAPDRTTHSGLRDATILELLYSIGLRRAEAVGLDLLDLDLLAGTLTVVRGKGGYSRLLPIGDQLADVLELYLRQGRPRFKPAPSEPALFLSRTGTRLAGQRVASLLAHYAKKAGLRQVTPHSLRHACATHLLEGGADLREVQAFLGHANLHSTSIYSHVVPLEAMREHQRTHPRAQRRSFFS